MNASRVKSQIRATEEELANLSTLRDELTEIRTVIYSSGEGVLMALGKAISDGSEFRLADVKSKHQYQTALQQHLSRSQRDVIQAWRSDGRKPLTEIESDIQHLTAQLEGLRSALPTPEQIAKAESEVESLRARQVELHGVFHGFFGRLETVLSELESDLWNASRSRQSGLQINRDVDKLVDSFDLGRKGGHLLFELPIDRQHALLTRLQLFVNMARSYEP